MTFERDPSFETLEYQRLIAVHAFSIAALGFNRWIASVGAKEDVGMDFWALQQGKEDPRVDPTEWRRNLAAMRIMQTLAYSIDELRPIVILPEIPAAEDLYRAADETVEQVGLNRLPVYDMNVIGPPIRCFLKDTAPETKIEMAVQQVRINRGVVKEEVTTVEEMAESAANAPEKETLEDLQVLPNGMLAEIHKFPESPTRPVETSFYQHYVSSSGGAEAYLKAFLEDVRWVSDQF
jgi:hypothetical protein